jgi:exo-beta-1,3-glucanase (GH17 family)
LSKSATFGNKLFKLSTLYFLIIIFVGFFSLENTGKATNGKDAEPAFSGPGVAYQPRTYTPTDIDTMPTIMQIKEELNRLRNIGFRGLVTYSSVGTLGSVPQLARKEGFDGTVIMGIWDPASNEEWQNAIAQAPYVDGYCVGNEGLGVRYTAAELETVMSRLRKQTGIPVTTSEPIDSYLNGKQRDWLLSHSDWLFPMAHPYWASQQNTRQAIDWIVSRYDYLTATAGTRVIIKEAGLPTEGSGIDEKAQLVFFQFLETTDVPFFYFEAFDQPWKGMERAQRAEANWGLFRSDGTPKKVVFWLMNRTGR